MANAKIEVEIGQFRFSGEGEQQWLAQQMDKILKSAESLTKLVPSAAPTNLNLSGNNRDETPHTDETLPHFLQRTKATKTQVDKFLATAEWLHRKGHKQLSTSDVSKAITNAHQTKLKNASDCLGKNTQKGYCEKNGKSFYVTDLGREYLGLD